MHKKLCTRLFNAQKKAPTSSYQAEIDLLLQPLA